jgi:hypothetical protein
VSVRASHGTRPEIAFWLTPLYSVTSWRRSPMVDFSSLRRPLIALPLWLSALGVYRYLVVPHVPAPGIALAYVLAIEVYILCEVGSAAAQLLCAPLGRVIPPLHRNPIAARSLGDVWGVRWNLHVNVWLRERVFLPLRNRTLVATLVTFLVSGLWHELLINTPYFVVTHHSRFGTMLAYFAIQALGVMLERKLPPSLRRPLLWLWVIAPAPLFVGEPIRLMLE